MPHVGITLEGHLHPTDLNNDTLDEAGVRLFRLFGIVLLIAVVAALASIAAYCRKKRAAKKEASKADLKKRQE